MLQSQLLHPQFHVGEVVASVVIAAIASFAALTLAARVGARRGRDQHHWLVGGGVAMGLGISAMHFVGMVAMRLPVGVAYESGRTVLSVVVAIGASTLALAFAGGATMRAPRLVAGAFVFGGAIVGMHYLGMSAIRAPVVMDHDLSRVALSILIAIATAATALWLAFNLRELGGRVGLAARIASATIMGLAVAGMHYTAMSAVRFHSAPNGFAHATPFDGPMLEGRGVSTSVITISVVILIGAIIAAVVDQRARRELRETQLTLEHRILEREAEAAMATELYALLAEHATDMVSTHRPDGRYAYVTPSWAEFVGAPASEIVGRMPVELAHPDDVDRLVSDHVRGLKSPDVITTEWRCRRTRRASQHSAPEYAWIETTTRAVRETTTGRVQTFVCASRDITERKRLTEKLTQSEARLRAALDGSFDGFLVMDAVRDADGRIIDFVYSELNPRAETIIGRPREQVLGHRMIELFPNTVDTHLAKMAHVVETRTPLEEEIELSLRGSPRWFHHQIIPLGDGVAVTTRDMTEKKLADEQLRALTLVDDLTGLYNRRGFRMLAEQHFRLNKRGGPISLLVSFDLNDFKRVNDVYGHAEGDAALRRVAAVLRQAFRDSDIIARFGGDEFSVLALDCGEFREQIIERVEAALQANNAAADRPYDISLSLGTARFDPFAPTTLDDLMAEADANVYESKRARGVRVVIGHSNAGSGN